MNLQPNTIIVSAALALLGGAASAEEFFGLEHTPIGQAELAPVPEGLFIMNLGSTGKDGVEVRIPPAPSGHRNFNVGMTGLEAMPGLEPAFDVRAVGTDLGGVPAVACSMHVDLGGQLVTFDFSALGPTTLGARYYVGDQLVLTETGIDPALASLSFAAIGPFEAINASAHFDIIKKIWILDGTLSTDLTVGGLPLPACDHWFVYTETASDAVSNLDSVQLLFHGMPSAVVTDEQVGVINVLCPADMDSSGAVDALDFLQLIGQWGACVQCEADLDENGVVDALDFLAVIASWGPCS